MEKEYKKRMTQCFGYSRQDRSMKSWKKVKGRRKVLKNYLLITVCKLLPDIELKGRLYRKTGLKLGRNVRIFGSNIDIFFPELIEIGNNSVIGNKTVILTHEFLQDGWKKGPVKIGSNVTVGVMTLIMPGVKIGDGARIASYSLVNKDVEPGTTVGGVPIKRLR
jgi:acetyltransferase-like isoleucine patch superfamily enzyme